MTPPDRRGTPISTLVVDDEPLARRNLTLLLRRDPDIGSIEECASGAEAVEAIRHRKPDLVFLDVQMPECGGFDVLELLGADLPQTIIFVTAHDEHALCAFEAGALDYLLKPFDDARFMRALARAKEKIAHYASHRQAPRRVVVKSPGRLLFIDVPDIDWVEAASYYACLHVGRETHVIRRTLSELERDLGDAFIRIHRSTIVNLERVRGLALQSSGEYAVVLRTGVELPVSRRYRKPLHERLIPASPPA
ncbi:LytR/AlgR family response regulator transcription factor [Luteimonas suaedae]|uniref:LytR/AlgR family response regulator transcription factor n=1 Tax=Luteimonas suaedae TaxID=2605430 RepID=UPI0011EE7659|nr:LytTR family DNA-binding domain-containing protein [Luteimonas suaedae]